jgi:hypothetical protein
MSKLSILLLLVALCFAKAEAREFELVKFDVPSGWDVKETHGGCKIELRRKSGQDDFIVILLGVGQSAESFARSVAGSDLRKNSDGGWVFRSGNAVAGHVSKLSGDETFVAVKAHDAIYSSDDAVNAFNNIESSFRYKYDYIEEDCLMTSIKPAVAEFAAIRMSESERSGSHASGSKGVKNIRKDGDKTYVDCNNGRILYIQPADSSRYGIGKCWGNATHYPTNCGELMNETIKWCSL